MCVGSTGDSSKSYISTDSEGGVHVTKCSGSDELKYYIKVDDASFYKKPKSYQVSYPTKSYENVVMIPNNMIYHETSKNNSNEYDYVWLIKDDEIIKQYVTLGEADKTKTVILSGLSEGDVIAKESGATSTGAHRVHQMVPIIQSQAQTASRMADRIHLAEMRRQQSSREEI